MPEIPRYVEPRCIHCDWFKIIPGRGPTCELTGERVATEQKCEWFQPKVIKVKMDDGEVINYF
jgi:hypothetical protein